MKFIHFDSIGGASGDMILAALIDLGLDKNKLIEALSHLDIGPFDISVKNTSSRGLRGTQINVIIPKHQHEHETSHGRNLKEILALIKNARLPEKTEKLSMMTFERLAKAEGKIHSCAPDQIHFHEVGAEDSIVDIVASCLALHMLKVEGVSVGILPTGHGTTKCHHGLIPIPAPATIELLQGFKTTHTEEPFELVTPTGAALLTTWKTTDNPPPGCEIISAGYGIGHRELTMRPNLLRAVLMELPQKETSTFDECLVLECNMDDINPELTGSLFETLLQEGALDVFITPVQMKKQRPGIMLTVLCVQEKKNKLLDLIFRESTTFGVREYTARRTILERSYEQVETPFGKVTIKLGIRNGEVLTRAPEHKDCAQLAAKTGASIRSVYEAALKKS